MKLRILGCSGGIGGRHLRTTSMLIYMAIIYLVNDAGMSFDVAHGYVGKGFSFIVLLALAMIVFDLVPEIYDDLLDLYHLGQPEKKKDEKKPPEQKQPEQKPQ